MRAPHPGIERAAGWELRSTLWACRSKLPRSLATAVPRELPPKRHHEARVVAHVPAPQTARLVGQPVCPLKASLLDPIRRLWNEPGVEVERRADPDQQRGVQEWAHARHPLLLLWHADAHPDDVCP